MKFTAIFIFVNIGLTLVDIIFNNKSTLDFFFLLGLVESAFFCIIGAIIAFIEPYEQKSVEETKSPRRNSSFQKNRPLTRLEAVYYGKIFILTGISMFIVVGSLDIFV